MTRQVKPDATLSRRGMLQWLGALGVGSAYGLGGCSDDSSGGSRANPDAGDGGDAGDAGPMGHPRPADASVVVPEGGDAGKGASGALDALRALLRKSPDHLVARAADAVATKDATKIAAFVRDHVTVLPGIGRGDDPEIATYSRWGAAPTLRAGAGSLRDRADLMVMLLAAAGIASTVKAIKTPSGLTAPDLYAPRANSFSLDLAEVEGVTKMSASAVAAGAQDASLETDTAFDATVSAILDASKAAVTSLPMSDLPVPTRVPVVVPGASAPTSGSVMALIAVADQAVATVDATDLLPATDANVSNIGITVSALMNPPAGGGSPTYTDLVTGSWPIDQVAGHQAQIVFMPRDGAAAALSGPLSSQHVRIPTIRIQPRPGVELDPRAEDLLPPSMRTGGVAGDGGIPSMKNALGAVGAPFTIDGELITVASGSAPSPDAPLVILDDKAHTAAVKSVAKIDATINASTFPTVELDLSITDTNGDSVDGLVAPDLTVTEDGAPVAITLVANRAPSHPPRVLIAYDASGSTVNFWPTPAARQAFEQSIATALTNVAKQHPFEVQVIGLAGNVDPKGWFAPTVNAVTAAIDGAASMSDVWATFVVGNAIDGGPAVILMVSDFDDPDPTYIDAAKKRLQRSGVPVVALTVGMVKEDVVAEIVSLSSGVEIAGDSPNLGTSVASFVDAAVARHANVSYRLRYDAPLRGKSIRTVDVALAVDKSISATGTYTVPAASARIVPPSVASVYVSITFAGVTERRRLGGAFVTDRGNALDDVLAQAAIDDARSVLDGVTTIAIEPASPQLALVLDDIVLAHQSIEPLREVWSTSNIDEFTRAGASAYRFPGIFAGLLPAAPPEKGAPIVVPRGLRVAILCERPLDGKVLRQVDMPPRLNAMRAMTGGAKDLEGVVRASLALSLNEARAFDESAYATLANRPLALVAPAAGLPMAVRDAYAKDPATLANLQHQIDDYAELIRLVPTDGGDVAFWVVDPTSGSVAAVDASGRGGGSSNLETLITALNVVLFCAGLPCSLGIVVWPIYCIGITILSVVITVAALFTGPVNEGTPFGVFGTVFGASTKFRPPPPKLTGGNVFLTLLLILFFLISLESFD